VTTPPDGQGGSPSVAALAVHVSSLRRDVESLAGTVDGLSSTQRQHAILLDSVAELRSQIDHIHALLTGEDDETPATWFWLTMPDQEHQEKLAELADWVETVFRAQYPGYLADQVRPCWANHPEARWELAWLYQLWTHAYLTERTALKDAADWHDRWAPGVIRRLSAVMRRCESRCQRQPDAKSAEDTYHPPAQ
jgi:hypothetical protein